jgi:hypothetical protein
MNEFDSGGDINGELYKRAFKIFDRIHRHYKNPEFEPANSHQILIKKIPK